MISDFISTPKLTTASTAKADYVTIIDRAFQEENTKAAHQSLIPTLQNMSHEPQILYDALARLLSSNEFFSETKVGPVIGIDLHRCPNYHIRVNCFFPLPDRSSNISHNWIHHHDVRSLTTVNTFGDSGYNSILFKKDFSYHWATKRAKMSIEREFIHGLHNVEYIPPFVPHVVFIPPSLTITYALWSSPKSMFLDKLLNSRSKEYLAKPIKNLADKVHSRKPLDLLIDRHSHHRQFAPNKDHFSCVGNKRYCQSNNANYVQNIFYALQEVGFQNAPVLSSLRDKSVALGRPDVTNLIDKYFRNDNIRDIYDPAQLATLGINFTRESVITAARTC